MHGYDCKSIEVLILKKAYIAQMDLCVMKIKVRIIPFTHGIGYIENARFRFKSQPQTKTKESIIEIEPWHIIPGPAPIQESK